MSCQRSFRLQVQIRQLGSSDLANTPHISNHEATATASALIQNQILNKYGPSDLTHQFIVLAPGTITLGALKTHILEKYEKLYNSKQKDQSLIQLRDKNNYDLDDDYLVYEIFSPEDTVHIIMENHKPTKRINSKKRSAIDQISKHDDDESVKKLNQKSSNILPTPGYSSPVLQPEKTPFIDESQSSTITPHIPPQNQHETTQPNTTTPPAENEELPKHKLDPEVPKKSRSKTPKTTVPVSEIKNTPATITESIPMTSTDKTSQIGIVPTVDTVAQQTIQSTNATVSTPKKSRSRKPNASTLPLMPNNPSLTEVNVFRESFDDHQDPVPSNPIVEPQIIHTSTTSETAAPVVKKPKERKKPLSSVPSIKNMIIESPVSTLPQLTAQPTIPQNENSNRKVAAMSTVDAQSTDIESEYSSKLFSK